MQILLKNTFQKNSLRFFNVKFCLLSLTILLFVFINCHAKKQSNSYEVTTLKPPNIVLLNIGDYDREYIGRLLMMVDSCKPSVIVVNAFFLNEKDAIGDSLLCQALRKCDNDILVYGQDSRGRIFKSADKFRLLAASEGLPYPDEIEGIASHFTPFKRLDSSIHKHVALAVVEKLKPAIKWKYEINEQVQIKFTKSLPDIENYKIIDLDPEYFENFYRDKIVILTYLGPEINNMYFTPMRFNKDYGNYPDTYGGVVLANIINTILGKYDFQQQRR